MTREQRERFKRRLLAKYPHLVEEYRQLVSDNPYGRVGAIDRGDVRELVVDGDRSYANDLSD